MAGETVAITLGRTTLTVPVYRDEQTTRAIAERITRELARIEEHSPRIDTQYFALMTAYYFAMELARTEDRQAAAEQELAAALDRLYSTLISLASGLESS